MISKYESLIREYCTRSGVSVPSGFGRHPASPIAVIRTDVSPPKLVAKTWFKTADLIYYLENLLGPEIGIAALAEVRILDFNNGVELRYDGTSRLSKRGELILAGRS